MSVLSRSSLILVHPCDPWFTLLGRRQVEAPEEKRAVMPVREDHLHAVGQLPAVHGAIVREIHLARVFVFDDPRFEAKQPFVTLIEEPFGEERPDASVSDFAIDA